MKNLNFIQERQGANTEFGDWQARKLVLAAVFCADWKGDRLRAARLNRN